MGLLSELQGDRIYLDTNIWIYALEGYPMFQPALTSLFEQIDAGALMAVTSELSLAELLVKPCQDDNLKRQAQYKEAIANRSQLFVVPILRDILIDAAMLRAKTTLKLPNAIHVSTALQTECTTFLTNDQRLTKITALPVVRLCDVL